MRLYKFRQLTSCRDLERIIEILETNKFYSNQIIPKSKQILEYKKYKEKLEKFLKERRIEFENFYK